MHSRTGLYKLSTQSHLVQVFLSLHTHFSFPHFFPSLFVYGCCLGWGFPLPPPIKLISQPTINSFETTMQILYFLEILLPLNGAACFWQCISMNATLKISPHGKGSTAIYVCTRALYVHTIGLLLRLCMCTCCQSLLMPPSKLSHPRIVATSNRALKKSHQGKI